MPSPIITLLTDFGQQDGYVGVMKGVISSIAPNARIIDISHEVQPQDLRSAAFLIYKSFRYFPEGSIHVVVVDPGVGSARKIIHVSANGHSFLAPDNGVMAWIFEEFSDARVTSVTNRDLFLPEVSQTFHGRDIFAPVSAHLAKGVLPDEIGEQSLDFQKGYFPSLIISEDHIAGEIVYVDRFGNLITNIPVNNLHRDQVTVLGKASISGLSTSYNTVPAKALLAIKGSSGFLEIAINGDSAQKALGCQIGAPVQVLKRDNKESQ